MARTHRFVALYAGQSVASARLIAASANPELIGHAAEVMLGEAVPVADDDPALAVINQSRRRALEIVQGREADLNG